MRHEKRHAVLAAEYDTLHQILHPKPTAKPQPRQACYFVRLVLEKRKVASDSHELAITTLREQIELSEKGRAHAQLLDSVLALWLESHVLNC